MVVFFSLKIIFIVWEKRSIFDSVQIIWNLPNTEKGRNIIGWCVMYVGINIEMFSDQSTLQKSVFWCLVFEILFLTNGSGRDFFQLLHHSAHLYILQIILVNQNIFRKMWLIYKEIKLKNYIILTLLKVVFKTAFSNCVVISFVIVPTNLS